MKKAIVLQHMNYDHPGRFLDYFAEDDIIPHPVRLFEGEDIPNLAGFDLMFVLGGAMDTWEEAENPWLVAEKAAIREWVMVRAKPYFGVCLGHQLLATALGGEVAPATAGEVGVFDVALTDEGRSHPLMRGVPATSKVMQWHHAEVKRSPEGAQVLAQSTATAVQALAVGTHAMSTQFHCEFSPQSVATWRSIPEYIAALEKHTGAGGYDRLIAASFPLMPSMAQMTRTMWNNLKRGSGL